MNPSDSLQQDWRLYFDGAWMRHHKHGPGLLAVDGDDLWLYLYPDGTQESTPKKVSPNSVECWWPQSGSFNTPNGAVYVARKATRSMRKSGCAEHYYVRWGHGLHQSHLMVMLRQGHQLVDLDFALQAMKQDMTRSVAITNDIILNKLTHEKYEVIWRGTNVGKVTEKSHYLEWELDYPDSVLGKRIMMKLREEGLV